MTQSSVSFYAQHGKGRSRRSVLRRLDPYFVSGYGSCIVMRDSDEEKEITGANVRTGDRMEIPSRWFYYDQQSEQMYSVGVGVGEFTGVGAPGPTGSLFMPVLDGLAWISVSSG